MSRETLQLARASSRNENQFDLQPVCTYFYRTCEKFPSRPAQRFNADLYHGDNNGRFTYAEMRERVEDIACGILSLGLSRQDRVGIMSRPGPYWTHADMAVACCAGVSVTVYPTLSADEVALDKSFTDDLDIDSISMMTIVVNAEEKFGVTIPDEEVKNLKTVGDAVTFITTNQG